MAFQPFGYKFEVRSPASPAAVKSAIRSGLAPWFQANKGARGWVIGPVICLWFSAFDRYGPMVLARISRDGSGARVQGRAGSDLNGLVALLLVAPFLIPFMLGLIVSGAVTGWRALFLGALALAMPLALFGHHRDRHQADPLVRFLRKVAPSGERPEQTGPAKVHVANKNLTLSLSGTDLSDPVTAESIERALLSVGAGDFVIVGAASENYIQAATHNATDFIIERRDGSESRHFQAMRAGVLRTGVKASDFFSYDEVLQAVTAFATEAPMPGVIIWKAMPPQGPAAGAKRNQRTP